MDKKLLGIFSLFLFLTACNDYVPKPIGYNRIESITSSPIEYEFDNFSFKLPSITHIDTLESKTQNEIWFNIIYPEYRATIYFTYLPITKSSLGKAIDDSYHMAYSHSLKAHGIEQQIYTNSNTNVSGILYDIDGSVATPLQFFVTDSIKHFLRGSLYYSQQVNPDSIAPVNDFIKQDIEQMFASFKWKK